MGGCFSVSLSCDQVVNQVTQWLCLKESYIHNLSENLASLERAMELLKAKRDDVQGRVNREEFTGRQRRLAQVQVWLTSVAAIENRFDLLVSTSKVELQRLCMCNFCSKNFKQSYKYGKQVIMMLKEVETLSSQGEFDVVTEAAPIAEVEEMPIQPTVVGQEKLLERVWNRLMEDGVGILGLYGMGGVGKTTLLMQINNKFSQTGDRFDVVIWVVVSNGATIQKVQGDLAEKLGLRGEEWERKNENQRALSIYNVLRRRKFVLLFDDIWEKVNLKAVGVPYPSRENGCKIVYTTRSKDVCGRMGDDDPIEVTCLDPEKAWDLFEKKVGVNTMRSDPDIPKLARKVAEKCRGLPLALNVIGETMACKTTVEEWHHAIDVLTSSSVEFSGMENEILPILKYSYDNLNGEKVKSCFLYCSLFPEDCRIAKESLIEYFICEGFIEEKKGRERALNQGFEILGTLVRTSLLLEHDQSSVRMHDVVREMALWIASDLGKHKDQYIVQAGVGLSEVSKVENWRVVKRMSLMSNDIEKIVDSPECPQLTTLFLESNRRLSSISGSFFCSMPNLLVLDLSDNFSLDELPEEISKLVSLRYLNLSETNIKRLPFGLQELKRLTHLNLEHTEKLKSLTGISNLSSLRTFRLRYSKVILDINLLKELQLLQNLEFVSINISPSMIGEQWFYNSRVGKCVLEVYIQEFPKESVQMLVLPVMVNLRDVEIESCEMSEIKIENTMWNKSLTSQCFANLSSVTISECDGLKDLTWLLFAPNLFDLEVAYSEQIEAIISKEKATSVLEDEGDEKCITIPFRKLESLFLSGLPMLKSIYWSSLPFPCLRGINISECPNLKKLPLDSQSVVKIEEFTIDYEEEEWKERIEWEDEATRLRFLSCFKFNQPPPERESEETSSSQGESEETSSSQG